MTETNPTDWLFFADSDLALAQAALEKSIYHLACFHAQQAVEKFLKACLVKQQARVRKTHSLVELYELVVPFTPDLRDSRSMLEKLDQYYVPTRYPDALPGSLPEGLPNEDDAKRAIEDAEALSHLLRPLLTKA